MFGLLKTRKRSATRPHTRQIRLSLETLEDRDCPSAVDLGSLVFGPPEPDVGAGVHSDAAPGGDPSNEAPSINLSISYGSGRMVTLSGQVVDEEPGGLTVTFAGVVDGSVITNSDGTFSIELEAYALGTIEATTVDSGGLWSNTATVEVVSDPPAIVDYSVEQGANNIFTFRGRVIDESAAGLTIQFAGLPSVENQSVTVEENGWFCYVVQLEPGEEGTVSAVTTDWWGLASNEVYYVVRQS